MGNDTSGLIKILSIDIDRPIGYEKYLFVIIGFIASMVKDFI